MRYFFAIMALAVTSPAEADCLPPNIFDNFDAAFRVVVAQPASAQRVHGAPVRFRVERTLRGPRAPSVLHRAGFYDTVQSGRRHLLFLARDGVSVAPCSTRVLSNDAAAGEAISALARYGASASHASRAAILAELISGNDTFVAEQAAKRLVDDPELSTRLTEAHDQALTVTLSRYTDWRTGLLALLLARRHVISAAPAILARLREPDPANNARSYHDALELLTNHHDPAYSRGQDIPAEQLAGLHQRWQGWLSARQHLSASQLVAAGYRERGIAPPTTPAEAQALVEAGPDLLTRSVALADCERRRATGRQLTSYFRYTLPPQAWQALARRCVLDPPNG